MGTGVSSPFELVASREVIRHAPINGDLSWADAGSTLANVTRKTTAVVFKYVFNAHSSYD
jgi:hypothetical protein